MVLDNDSLMLIAVGGGGIVFGVFWLLSGKGANTPLELVTYFAVLMTVWCGGIQIIIDNFSVVDAPPDGGYVVAAILAPVWVPVILAASFAVGIVAVGVILGPVASGGWCAGSHKPLTGRDMAHADRSVSPPMGICPSCGRRVATTRPKRPKGSRLSSEVDLWSRHKQGKEGL